LASYHASAGPSSKLDRLPATASVIGFPGPVRFQQLVAPSIRLAEAQASAREAALAASLQQLALAAGGVPSLACFAQQVGYSVIRLGQRLANCGRKSRLSLLRARFFCRLRSQHGEWRALAPYSINALFRKFSTACGVYFAGPGAQVEPTLLEQL